MGGGVINSSYFIFLENCKDKSKLLKKDSKILHSQGLMKNSILLIFSEKIKARF
jgi:hypothetical protein